VRRHRQRWLAVPKAHRDRSASFPKTAFVNESGFVAIEDEVACAGTDQRSIPLAKQPSLT